jgi:hypothetical protein
MQIAVPVKGHTKQGESRKTMNDCPTTGGIEEVSA